MNETAEAATEMVLKALASLGVADEATVVLIGSSARNTMNERSDVDILVLHDDDRRIRLERPGDVHLQQDSHPRFLRRLENGDDYPGWALRFGIAVRDPKGWWGKHVAAELDDPHWPDWRAKVDHAKKRMRMASDLLAVGDLDAASEELMFATSHIARAVLLKHGHFPLSRPELPSQLETIEPTLAQLLDRLIVGDLDVVGLQSGESLLKHQIDQL
jgi:hypothetical protein